MSCFREFMIVISLVLPSVVYTTNAIADSKKFAVKEDGKNHIRGGGSDAARQLMVSKVIPSTNTPLPTKRPTKLTRKSPTKFPTRSPTISVRP